jgi:MFS family permease
MSNRGKPASGAAKTSASTSTSDPVSASATGSSSASGSASGSASISDSAPPWFLLILSYALLVACYFFTAFYRISASVVMPRLAAETGMTGAVTGFVSSLYFYAYAAAQPIGGALNDRFGPGRVVSAGILVAALGALAFAFGTHPAVFAAGRFLMGLGLGPMLSGTLVFIGKTRLVTHYTLYTGIVLTLGNLGAVVSVYPLGASISMWGRGPVFFGLALVNVLLALLLIGSLRKARVDFSHTLGHSVFQGIGKAIGTIKSDLQLRRILLPWFIQMGSIMAFQGLWAVSWFEAVYQIPFLEAQRYASLISIGVMVGHFAGGYIGPSTVHRKTMIVTASFTYAFLWGLFWVAMQFLFPIGLTAAIGLMLGMAIGVSFDHLVSSVNDRSAQGEGGSNFGVINFFAFLGAVVYQWATGVLISLSPNAGSTPSPNASSTAAPAPSVQGAFSAAGFQITFLVVALTVLLAAVLLLRLKRYDTC